MLDDATRERLLKSLEHNCGPVIMDAVRDPAVIEIMLNPDGKIMAVNDIGIIVMPDGSHFSIAVFIADAACDMASCEETIAGITECVFNFFDRNNKKNLQRKKCWLSLQSQTNSEGSSLKSVS